MYSYSDFHLLFGQLRVPGKCNWKQFHVVYIISAPIFFSIYGLISVYFTINTEISKIKKHIAHAENPRLRTELTPFVRRQVISLIHSTGNNSVLTTNSIISNQLFQNDVLIKTWDGVIGGIVLRLSASNKDFCSFIRMR